MADEAANAAREEAAGEIWFSAWLTIWYRPRATIRRIVDTAPRRFVVEIAWLAGTMAAFDVEATAASIRLPARVGHLPRFGPIGMAVFAVVMGVLNVVVLYAAGALLRWAGYMLGGTANAAEVRAGLVWAEVPSLCFSVATIFAIALGLYMPAPTTGASPDVWLRVILAIWFNVILLKCIGEVHRFSAWRALGAMVLGCVAVLAVVAGTVITVMLAVRASRLMM